jgi:hypothetical protein
MRLGERTPKQQLPAPPFQTKVNYLCHEVVSAPRSSKPDASLIP